MTVWDTIFSLEDSPCIDIHYTKDIERMFRCNSPTPRVGWVEDVPSWPHLCSDADLLPVGNLQQTVYTKPLFVQHTTPVKRGKENNLNEPSVGVACQFEGGCLWSSFDMMLCIDTRHVYSKYAAHNSLYLLNRLRNWTPPTTSISLNFGHTAMAHHRWLKVTEDLSSYMYIMATLNQIHLIDLDYV